MRSCRFQQDQTCAISSYDSRGANLVHQDVDERSEAEGSPGSLEGRRASDCTRHMRAMYSPDASQHTAPTQRSRGFAFLQPKNRASETHRVGREFCKGASTTTHQHTIPCVPIGDAVRAPTMHTAYSKLFRTRLGSRSNHRSLSAPVSRYNLRIPVLRSSLGRQPVGARLCELSHFFFK
ncbi:hypothetical protein CALCODRAFT_207277 [Calocera cornea HHB12733]|uniref:Uncharacterized protein n=1 Tax=Calocera cornea HHB12733 TaxID=1353952 RepID=A0A165K258_9BASI|nr:hypothetical protein CALCODRAFT_207277 [Calocera cornea HHB12733]